MVGLVGDHVGPAAVLQALFGSGEGRLCKPERALASCPAPDEAAGTERTYDMAIQSKALWPEQMYLDRFTVRDGKARAALRACSRPVPLQRSRRCEAPLPARMRTGPVSLRAPHARACCAARRQRR